MQNFTSPDDRPTPLPTDPTWYKKFNAAIGDPDPKAQAKLVKQMQLTYHSGVGELIRAMTTTRPDLGWEFQFLIPISGTPTGSGIPDPFPIPKIPVGKILIEFCC